MVRVWAPRSQKTATLVCGHLIEGDSICANLIATYSGASMTTQCKWLLVPIAIFNLTLFTFISRHRLIDGDEGSYLLACKLVFQHKTLYHDFVYPQMPLLPYLYGGWMKIVSTSWYSARFLSVLLTTLLALSLYIHVCRETGKWFVSVLATLLFGFNSAVLEWFCIVKTFPLADLFLFLAYMLAASCYRNTRKWTPVVVGLLVGLSVDTRLYYIALIPLFVSWYGMRLARPDNARASFAFLVGFAAAISPNLYWFALGPRVYIFDNIGIHTIHSGYGLAGQIGQKVATAARVLIVGGPEGNGIQMLILILLGLTCLTLLRRQRHAVWFAYAIAGILFVVSLLPTPTLFSYFSVVVPFIVAGLAISISSTWDSLEGRQKYIPAARLLLLFVGMSYVLPCRRDLHNYLGLGEGVPGIESWKRAPDYQIEAVRRVSRAIDDLAKPGEPILSVWPGYLVESSARAMPGTENNFGLYFADRFSSPEREKYRIMSLQQLREALETHHIRVAIIGNQDTLSENPAFGSTAMSNMLLESGYQVARRFGATTIYVPSVKSSHLQ